MVGSIGEDYCERVSIIVFVFNCSYCPITKLKKTTFEVPPNLRWIYGTLFKC